MLIVELNILHYLTLFSYDNLVIHICACVIEQVLTEIIEKYISSTFERIIIATRQINLTISIIYTDSTNLLRVV